MPQVDFITFFPVIFWFCIFLLVGFIFLNFWISLILVFEKKNYIVLEKIFSFFLLKKQYWNFFTINEAKDLKTI